jgi:hypothetical protein
MTSFIIGMIFLWSLSSGWMIADPVTQQPSTESRGASSLMHQFNDINHVDGRHDSFIENLGQLGESNFLFFANTREVSVGLRSDGLVLTPLGLNNANGPADHDPNGNRSVSGPVEYSFSECNPVTPVGISPLDHYSNYLIGSDPNDWVTGAKSFREIWYKDIFDGIDLQYTIVGGQLKYSFFVEPGADPRQIVTAIKGHTDLQMDMDGNLRVTTPWGVLTDSGLIAQYVDGSMEAIGCSFEVLDENRYGFLLNEYDTDRTIVIDPLIYSTYFGGDGEDRAVDIAIDDDNNVYISGYTDSHLLPTTPGALQEEYGGGIGYAKQDAFLLKYGPDGSGLIYATYIGGEARDKGSGVAVDGEGYAIVVGTTTRTVTTPPTAS